MRIGYTFIAGLCLGTAVVSQNSTLTSHIVPPWFATTEATGSSNNPLGRSVPVRAQYAYGGSLFRSAFTVKSTAYRPDRTFVSPGKRILELGVASVVEFGGN